MATHACNRNIGEIEMGGPLGLSDGTHKLIHTHAQAYTPLHKYLYLYARTLRYTHAKRCTHAHTYKFSFLFSISWVHE